MSSGKWKFKGRSGVTSAIKALAAAGYCQIRAETDETGKVVVIGTKSQDRSDEATTNEWDDALKAS
jgi:hypothetical protein